MRANSQAPNERPAHPTALALTVLYGLGAFVFAAAIFVTEPKPGFIVFSLSDLIAIVFVMYALPLTALLWIGWGAFRFAGATRTTPFIAFGVVLPFLSYAATLAPAAIERAWHNHQLGLARIAAISDEPLLGDHGRPIGVRLTFRVDFPLGLSPLGQEPPVDAPMADISLATRTTTLLDFTTRDSTLWLIAKDGFPHGASSIAVDFVPPFLPSAMQHPKSFPASDPRNLCFRWKSDEQRQRMLALAAQPLSIEIGPYGRYLAPGSRRTQRAYDLSAFYESARADGATECP